MLMVWVDVGGYGSMPGVMGRALEVMGKALKVMGQALDVMGLTFFDVGLVLLMLGWCLYLVLSVRSERALLEPTTLGHQCSPMTR
jgi:hypothetical protein